MNSNRGFTILETVMVMLIIGIMAALTFVKYRDSVAASELEKAANSLYMELRGLRAAAFKYDCLVIAKFINNNKCGIWVDTNDNKRCDGSDIYKEHLLPPPVTIGISTPQPTSWKHHSPTGPLNTWKDSLVVENDSRGEYSHGSVYLMTPLLQKINYSITIKDSMQSIEFYKWDGTKWNRL